MDGGLLSGMERIDLAHRASFPLGALVVHPATREIAAGDSPREVLEPRVMQVLVALASANGAIVSRDDLSHSCWEGRVVGEDAINRVISRLRRVAEGIGANSFRIETVTKVGYRLVLAAAPATDAREVARVAAPAGLDRRTLVGGSVALAALVAAGGAGLYLSRRRDATAPAAVAPLMQQAMVALGESTGEGQARANALLRQVTAQAPDYADGWGALALTYAIGVHSRAADGVAALAARANEAASRAFALDPDNGFARAAVAVALPYANHWSQSEAGLRKGLRDHPDNVHLHITLANNLSAVGRMREAADTLGQGVALGEPAPALYYQYFVALWAAGRLEECDALMAKAYALFPLHFAVWYSRFYILMYTGRAREAIAMADNVEGRPPGTDEREFDTIVAVARATLDPRPATIDAALAPNIALAHEGAGYAENTMQFASWLGRVDTAFEMANAYYFDRGFSVPSLRFIRGQGTYSSPPDRRTAIIFLPSMARMRADPRFETLVGDLGLADYWRKSGTHPDYRA